VLEDAFDKAQEWQASANTHAPTLELDPAKYWQYVEGFDLTDAEKLEVLKTVWSALVLLMRSGLGKVSAEQIVLSLACGDSDSGVKR